MKVLIFNCGSSTLKFQVLALDEDTPPGGEKRLARGIVERIGSKAMLKFVGEKGPSPQETARDGQRAGSWKGNPTGI
jgi:acetate kinase